MQILLVNSLWSVQHIDVLGGSWRKTAQKPNQAQTGTGTGTGTGTKYDKKVRMCTMGQFEVNASLLTAMSSERFDPSDVGVPLVGGAERRRCL